MLSLERLRLRALDSDEDVIGAGSGVVRAEGHVKGSGRGIGAGVGEARSRRAVVGVVDCDGEEAIIVDESES